MKEVEPQRFAQNAGEALNVLSMEDGDARISLLATLLDACLLFHEEGIYLETLRHPFRLRWPDESLDRVSGELLRVGLVERKPDASITVPAGSRLELAAAVEDRLWGQSLGLPDEEIPFRRLMSGFIDYCQTELRILPEARNMAGIWGGSAYRVASRWYFLLIRPGLLVPRVHPEAYTLVLTRLPEAVARNVAAPFATVPAIRHRLALYDLEGGVKINVTRGELFVHFERYLREAYGLRLAPSPAITESLRDVGLINLVT